MVTSTAKLFLLSSLLLCCRGETKPEPVPKAWPFAFCATFLTNITDPSLVRNGSPIFRSAIVSELFYDYSFRAQRIEHGAGSYECLHFYSTSEQCTLIMNEHGMYRIGAQDPPCCLDMMEITCPPPWWASMAISGRDYLGEEIEVVSGIMCHHWRWPMGDDYSHYYQGIETGLAVRWTFPVAEGRQDWYFDLSSYRIMPQDVGLFELPANCAETDCSIISDQWGEHEHYTSASLQHSL